MQTCARKLVIKIIRLFITKQWYALLQISDNVNFVNFRYENGNLVLKYIENQDIFSILSLNIEQHILQFYNLH